MKKRVSQSVQLDHLNLSVTCFAESVQWYERVFGFELVEQGVDEGKPWGILRSGDSMLCIYENPQLEPLDEDEDLNTYHRVNHFGLRICDGDAWKQVLERYGIRVSYGGNSIRYPHSTSWYVSDPTGHRIEVVLWDGDQVRF